MMLRLVACVDTAASYWLCYAAWSSVSSIATATVRKSRSIGDGRGKEEGGAETLTERLKRKTSRTEYEWPIGGYFVR
jgi:hypothetical protein